MLKVAQVEAIYKFSANNKESLYAYGTEDKAQLYLDFLNEGKEIDLYGMEISDLTDEQVEALAINLFDNLANIAQC